jgi:hypothetical protein
MSSRSRKILAATSAMLLAAPFAVSAIQAQEVPAPEPTTEPSPTPTPSPSPEPSPTEGAQ